MATVTLENVPDEVVIRLELEARQNRRSLNQEIQVRLEQSFRMRPQTAEEKLAIIADAQARQQDMERLSEDFIQHAKKSGRP